MGRDDGRGVGLALCGSTGLRPPGGFGVVGAEGPHDVDDQIDIQPATVGAEAVVHGRPCGALLTGGNAAGAADCPDSFRDLSE